MYSLFLSGNEPTYENVDPLSDCREPTVPDSAPATPTFNRKPEESVEERVEKLIEEAQILCQVVEDYRTSDPEELPIQVCHLPGTTDREVCCHKYLRDQFHCDKLGIFFCASYIHRQSSDTTRYTSSFQPSYFFPALSHAHLLIQVAIIIQGPSCGWTRQMTRDH